MRWYKRLLPIIGLTSVLSCIKGTTSLEHIIKERSALVKYDEKHTIKVLEEYKEKANIKPVNTFFLNDIKITMYVSEHAAKLFHSTPEKLSTLEKNVEKETKDALLHMSSYYPLATKDIHIVLRRTKYAEAKHFTSLLELDVYWFYMMFNKNHHDYAESIIAHELTHIQNYIYDLDEAKRDREFVAILAEAASLIKNTSTTAYLNEHAKFLGYIYDKDITKKDMSTQKHRRAVARYLVSALEKKLYTSPYTTLQTIEKLTAAYLTDPLNADLGFNNAAKLVGIKKGKRFLTLSELKKDAEASETSAPPPLYMDGFFD